MPATLPPVRPLGKTGVMEAARQSLVDEVRPLVEQDATQSQTGKGPLFWLHDTTVMGWKQQYEPFLVTY